MALACKLSLKLTYRAIVKSSLSGGFFFYNLEKISELSKPYKSKLSETNPNGWQLKVVDFMTAGTSKAITATIVNPINMLKTKAEAQGKNKPKRAVEMAKDVFKRNGIFGFFKGVSATIVRDVPYSGLQFMIYKWFLTFEGVFFPKSKNKKLKKDSEKSGKNSAFIFLNGGLSTALATVVTQPFDAIRVPFKNKKI